MCCVFSEHLSLRTPLEGCFCHRVLWKSCSENFYEIYRKAQAKGQNQVFTYKFYAIFFLMQLSVEADSFLQLAKPTKFYVISIWWCGHLLQVKNDFMIWLFYLFFCCSSISSPKIQPSLQRNTTTLTGRSLGIPLQKETATKIPIVISILIEKKTNKWNFINIC